MKLPFYQLSAFTRRPNGGNPAGVCPLERWPGDATLQAIATERALPATAFFVRDAEGDFALRWFTPTVELELCGHGTLASACVITTLLGDPRARLTFRAKSGPLTVQRTGDRFVLDFPALPAAPAPAPDALVAALGRAPRKVLRALDYLVVYEHAADVRALAPDTARLATIETRGVIATAPGDEPGVDYVARFFAPRIGIVEDSATGSSHCTLVPYWSARLGRLELSARQLSARGAEFHCLDRGERVDIGGEAVLVLEGVLHL